MIHLGLSTEVNDVTAEQKDSRPSLVTPLPASSNLQSSPKPKISFDQTHPNLLLHTASLLPREPAGQASTSVFETDPTGLAAEQFRLMQRRLLNVRPTGGSVLLTSPGAGDGKSFNAHNLAWAFAEAAQPTLLLDLDFRRPSQAKCFRSSPPVSIAAVLTGKETPEAALFRIDGTSLFFIGLQKSAANPVGLLRSAQLQQLMTWARRNFTWVVMDAPPILPISDVEELLPSADIVLMVVRERVTERAMLERAAERLGKRLDYMIFNDVTFSAAYGYGYGYN